VLASASASKGTLTGTNVKVMEVTVAPPAPIMTLRLSTPTPVIDPTKTAVITATLTDAAGAAVSGATVTLDTTLVFGTFSAPSGVTDASGKTTFTYTPPVTSKYPNQHLTEVIKANTSIPNTIVGDTQKASLLLFVQNDGMPDWLLLSTAVSGGTPNGLVVGPVTQQTNLTVTVTNWAGAPVAGIDVDSTVSDANNLTVAAKAIGANKTDVNGRAVFVATKKGPAANHANVDLRFVARNRPYSTSDLLELYVYDGVTAGNAAWLSFDARTMPFVVTGAQNNVTAHVTTQANVSAAGVPVFFQITYGDLGLPAQFDWAYDYTNSNYLSKGLDLNSFGMGDLGGSFAKSPVIGNPAKGTPWGVENFVEDAEVVGNIGTVDACVRSTWPAGYGFTGTYTINATSVTDASGLLKTHFTALPHKIDSKVQVKAYIGKAPNITVDACNFAAAAQNFGFAIDSGVAIQRAPVIALSSVKTDAPIFTSQSLTTTFHALFKGLNGATVSRPEVYAVQGPGPWCGTCTSSRNILGSGPNGRSTGANSLAGTLKGTSLGWVNYTRTQFLVSLSQAFLLSLVPSDSRFAYGGTDQLFAGAYGKYWFSPLFAAPIAKVPFDVTVGYLYLPTTKAFLTVTLDQTLLAPGGTATATVQVWSVLTGAPIAGASVWSGSTQVLTDATGTAKFNVTAVTQGATEGLVVATTDYGGAARGFFGYVSSPPVVTYGTPTVTAAEAGKPSTITVTVTNTLNVAGTVPVSLLVDNVTVATKSVSLPAGGSTTVSFTYTFATAGSHTVTVGSSSATASIPAPPVDVLLYGLAGGLLVVGLVVGVVVGRMMARGGKPPKGPGPTDAPKGEGQSEEEMSPEDNL
jgi:hypothetical protein